MSLEMTFSLFLSFGVIKETHPERRVQSELLVRLFMVNFIISDLPGVQTKGFPLKPFLSL